MFKKIVIIFGNGRLGNQIIQYQGISKHFKGEIHVFLGFESLREFFVDLNGIFIPLGAIYGIISATRLRFLVKNFLLFLVKARLTSFVEEDCDSSVFKLAVRRGFFSSLLVVPDCYFQHADVFVSADCLPSIDQNLREQALEWLRVKLFNSKKEVRLVFVNVRRGDYLRWPSDEYPAVLSLSW
jgi:hypothetical protein